MILIFNINNGEEWTVQETNNFLRDVKLNFFLNVAKREIEKGGWIQNGGEDVFFNLKSSKWQYIKIHLLEFFFI
jgi:hypothetical protein